MATLEKRVSKNGEVSWRVKIRVRGQAPINKTFQNKTFAQKWAKKTETEIEEGRYFPEAASKGKTLSDLIKKYLAHVQIDNPRRLKELAPIMNWWVQEFGQKPLLECKRAMFSEAQQKLALKNTHKVSKEIGARAISPSTINRYLVAMNTAINYAVRELQWLPSNPMDGLKRLKEPKGQTRYLSSEEISRLLDACVKDRSDHIFAAVLLGISTGRRKSAILNLKWENVNLETGRLLFWEAKTKTFAPSTVSGAALDLLKKKHAIIDDKAVLVFPSAKSRVHPVDIKKAWQRVLAVAKIEDFRFHDLRHTCASYLAMNGASLMELADILGHKTLSMVKRYAHLAEDHTSEIQKKMNEMVLGHVTI